MQVVLVEYIVLIIKKLISGRSRKIILLRDHDVFTSLDRARNEIQNVDFFTAKKFDMSKTHMCSDFAQSKTKTCADHMKSLIKLKDIDFMSKARLKRVIIKAQNEMHVSYIRDIRAIWLDAGIPSKDVDYVIRLFERFRRPVINAFEYRINSIFGSSYRGTNFDIMLSVMETWAMGIDLLPDDLSQTFENLNGRFKDIEY